MKTTYSRILLVSLACTLACTSAQAQQVPIPQTAAEVPGPAQGPMPKAWVQMVGRMAYAWGWPLVYVYNQRTALTKVPEPSLLNGALPVAPMNQVTMLTGYIAAGELFVGDPNQDVVYGMGFLALDKEPVVFQVPDFGNRFWTMPVYDARTDQVNEVGLQHASKPGFYMLVGPNWKGTAPDNIVAVMRASTNHVVAMPRIFITDSPEDQQSVQPALNQIVFYLLSQFDGKMKTKDWSKLPSVPAPPKPYKGPTKWVDPATFNLDAVKKKIDETIKSHHGQ